VPVVSHLPPFATARGRYGNIFKTQSIGRRDDATLTQVNRGLEGRFTGG
jgi:hypothetical protein